MTIGKAVIFGCCLMAAAASVLSAQGIPYGPTGPGSSAPAPAPTPAPAPAPAPAAPAVVAEAKLIAFEMGMNGGLKLGANAGTIGSLFGMDFTLTDSFSVGLVNSVAGNTSYTLVKLAYRLLPALGFDIYLGSDLTPATAAGAGVFYTVLKSKPDSGLATGVKLHLDYLVDSSAGFGKGDFVLGVVSYFGL
jgi:hypothetical protein